MKRNKALTIHNASRSSDRVYETIIYGDGSTSCNCPGWIYVKAGRERGCRHTKAAQAAIAPTLIPLFAMPAAETTLVAQLEASCNRIAGTAERKFRLQGVAHA